MLVLFESSPGILNVQPQLGTSLSSFFFCPYFLFFSCLPFFPCTLGMAERLPFPCNRGS